MDMQEMEIKCRTRQEQNILKFHENDSAIEGTSKSGCSFVNNYTLEKAKKMLLDGEFFQQAEAHLTGGFNETRAANMLYNLSKEDACAKTIAAGGVSLIVRFLKSPVTNTNRWSCITIARIAKFADDGNIKQAVPSLIRFLNTYTSHKDVFESATFALRSLAKAGEDLSVMIGSSCIGTLLEIALQSSGKQQVVALRTLMELVVFSEPNLNFFVLSGRLVDVIQLVFAASSEAKCLAAEILSTLAGLKDIRRAIIDLSAIPALIEAAKVGCITSRIKAAHALGLIACLKRSRKTIVTHEGISVLIDLLNSGNHSARLVAGNALGILSAHVDHLLPVAQAGAIPLYVKFLQGDDPLEKEIAEDALCILAVLEDNASVIEDHLVKILEGGNVESKVAAADLIWDLSSYKHSISILHCDGAAPLILSLLQDKSEEIRERISGAIAQMSYNDSDKEILADAGVIPILVRLLQDPSDDVKENAAEALHKFAEDAFYRHQMLETCAIPALVELQGSLSGRFRDEGTSDYVAAALHDLRQI